VCSHELGGKSWRVEELRLWPCWYVGSLGGRPTIAILPVLPTTGRMCAVSQGASHIDRIFKGAKPLCTKPAGTGCLAFGLLLANRTQHHLDELLMC